MPSLTSSATDKIYYWKKHSRKEFNRPKWDTVFLSAAFETAKRSHDAQTCCGAVLTTPEHRQLCTGYNGFMRDIDDSILPNLRPDKYTWMLHAERNVLLSCAYQGISTKGCIMYVTGEPCLDCYQHMYQAGITEIVYGDNQAVMTKTDEDYKTNVEIFLWLTRKNLKVRHVDFGV
jgi:dCMP deaminase